MCCPDCGGKMTAFADSYGGAYEGCENTYGTRSHESYHRGRRKDDPALLEACRTALSRRSLGCCGEKSDRWCLMCQDELLVLARLDERLEK